MGSSKAVFLDRDGVLNRPTIRNGRPYPPNTLEEVIVTEGASNALGRLKQAGFLLLVVSNQPDVARGTTTKERVDGINSFLSDNLPLDGFFVCYHDDSASCECRKPRPGLLVQAAAQFDIDLLQSFMIGDRWRDIDAGHAAGCHTILMQSNYAERGPISTPDAIVSSLDQAADWVLTYCGLSAWT